MKQAGGTMNFAPRALRGREELISKSGGKPGERLELLGWFLFVVSALFFIVASLRTGDVVGLLGGVFFFVACIVFLAAFGRRGGRDRK